VREAVYDLLAAASPALPPAHEPGRTASAPRRRPTWSSASAARPSTAPGASAPPSSTSSATARRPRTSPAPAAWTRPSRASWPPWTTKPSWTTADSGYILTYAGSPAPDYRDLDVDALKRTARFAAFALGWLAATTYAIDPVAALAAWTTATFGPSVGTDPATWTPADATPGVYWRVDRELAVERQPWGSWYDVEIRGHVVAPTPTARRAWARRVAERLADRAATDPDRRLAAAPPGARGRRPRGRPVPRRPDRPARPLRDALEHAAGPGLRRRRRPRWSCTRSPSRPRPRDSASPERTNRWGEHACSTTARRPRRRRRGLRAGRTCAPGPKAIFGVKREVLDGAVRLRGLTGAVTKAEVAAAIDAFASHPV
jgi:hypothetical protein